MTSRAKTTSGGTDVAANAVLGTLALVVFAAAYVEATSWPKAAALFPRIITVSGAIVSVCFLGSLAVSALRARAQSRESLDRSPAPRTVARTEESGEISGSEEEDVGLDYAFATATWTDWSRVLLWIFLYFAGVWAVGAVIATVALSVLYLKVEARIGLVAAAIYAAVLFGVLWASQEYFQLQLPPGLVGGR